MFKIFKSKQSITIPVAAEPVSNNSVKVPKDEERIAIPALYCSSSSITMTNVINETCSNTEKNKLINQTAHDDAVRYTAIYDVLYFLKFKKNRSTSAYNQIINEFLTPVGKADFEETISTVEE